MLTRWKTLNVEPDWEVALEVLSEVMMDWGRGWGWGKVSWTEKYKNMGQAGGGVEVGGLNEIIVSQIQRIARVLGLGAQKTVNQERIKCIHLKKRHQREGGEYLLHHPVERW